MIDDPEFRKLFQIESEEHLQGLDDGLLALEKTPNDSSVLAEVFRAAHSIKGAARMMNLPALERVAHELESVLGRAKGGDEELSAEIIDRLCAAVDAMRALCEEAVTGEPAAIDIDEVLATFHNHEAQQEDDTVEADEKAPAPPDDESPAPGVTAEDHQEFEANDTLPVVEQKEVVGEGIPVKSSSAEVKRIESIRVNTDRLDRLVAQAGELVVLRNRYGHRLSEFQQLTGMWSRCKKVLDELVTDKSRSGNFPAKESFTAAFEICLHMFVELGSLLKTTEVSAREDTTRLGFLTESLEDEIRSLRMLPLQSVFAVFPRLVRDLARSQGKEINLCVEGADTCADKAIIEEIKDPLSHMIRNAIDHGIETPEDRRRAGKAAESTLLIRAFQSANAVVIEMSDDGRGLDTDRIKSKAMQGGLISDEDAALMTDQQVHELIFLPGFSTADIVTDISGRGVGMDVVRSNVEKLKGSLEVESTPGRGTLFRMSFPLTLATTRALIFQCENWRYALPVDLVDRTLLLEKDMLISVGGIEGILLDSEVIPIFQLANLIPISYNSAHADRDKNSGGASAEQPCIIIEHRGEKVGLVVDDLQNEQEIVLKAHSAILERVPNVACSTILETGEICLVLNGNDLVRSVSKKSAALVRTVVHEQAQQVKRILLAEDSLTTRTQEKRILEAAGYEVVAAVDGADALEKLESDEFDLVVSDVEMPRLDGLNLAKKIREHQRYSDLPIILVTSLASDDDKRRGSEAGANAYITKGSFDHQLLLDTIRRFI